MYYGQNLDADVHFVAQTLGTQHNDLPLHQAVGRAKLEPFLANWLGNNLAPLVSVVPFYASSAHELEKIAMQQAREVHHIVTQQQS